MTKNARTAMALLRDYECRRFGNDMVVTKNRRTNKDVARRTAHSDIRILLDRGYVEIAEGDNLVTITPKGLAVNKKLHLCYRTRRAALRFVETHDHLVVRDGHLVAPNGKRLSLYAAQHLIDNGTLVLGNDGRYALNVRTISVPGAMYPAVRAFVEMLERARD